MKYTCKKCANKFEISEYVKGKTKCKFCGTLASFDTVEFESDKDLADFKEERKRYYKDVVNEYAETQQKEGIYEEFDDSFNYVEEKCPGFKEIWKNFIRSLMSKAVELEDKDFQGQILDHAKEYDKKHVKEYEKDQAEEGNKKHTKEDRKKINEKGAEKIEGSDIFETLLFTYPKAARKADWDYLIQNNYEKTERFATICEKIVGEIVNTSSRSFAIEIFNMLAAKKNGSAAARAYLSMLFDNEDVAESVFNERSFNVTAKRFINDVKRYNIERLAKGNRLAIEETKVWKKYELAEKNRRRKNFIVAFSSVAVVVIAAAVTLFYFNSVNKSTVEFKIDKVIEVVYGEDLDLSAYTVTYKKKSGEEITERITLNMLNGYDPEAVGTNQTVRVSFGGVTSNVTIIVGRKTLAKPVLSQSGNHVTWNVIPNADSYNVYVNSTSTPVAVTKDLIYDLTADPNFGEITVFVRANAGEKSSFNNSAMSEGLKITKLKAPENISYKNGILQWDEVEFATIYELSIEGTPYSTTDNFYYIDLKQGYTSVSITAESNSPEVISSVVKKEIYHYSLASIDTMTYQSGRISWNSVENANVYLVYVDGEYWKSFTRNYFDLDTDGYVSRFGKTPKKIEVVSSSSSVGVEDSAKKGSVVYIDNEAYIEDDNLLWSSIGTGATYFVRVNGEEFVLNAPILPLTKELIKDGENVVNVTGSMGEDTVLCESIVIRKLAKPSVRYENGKLVAESGSKVFYKFDNGEWTSDIPDINEFTVGEHTLYTKRMANKDQLELDSDQNVITALKINTPVISASYGEVVIDNNMDASKYNVLLYYAEAGSDEYKEISSLNNLSKAGDYSVKAYLTAKTGAFSGYDFILESNVSNVITVKKLEAPTLSYTDGDDRVKADMNNVRFFYVEEGTEKELKDGLIANLPGGIYEVYARKIADNANELDSENTISAHRVTIFNMNVTLLVNKMTSSQSQFYIVFGGCESIDELAFTYTFEYYDRDNTFIGDKHSQSEIVAKKTSASNDNIIYAANYRLDISFLNGYSQTDIYKVKITVKLSGGGGEQTLTYEIVV